MIFVSLFLPTAAATIIIIAQLIYTGNATCGKLIGRCVTKVGILLTIKPYPDLVEGITLLQFGG
jgi:hypothetical protein